MVKTPPINANGKFKRMVEAVLTVLNSWKRIRKRRITLKIAVLKQVSDRLKFTGTDVGQVQKNVILAVIFLNIKSFN